MYLGTKKVIFEVLPKKIARTYFLTSPPGNPLKADLFLPCSGNKNILFILNVCTFGLCDLYFGQIRLLIRAIIK